MMNDLIDLIRQANDLLAELITARHMHESNCYWIDNELEATMDGHDLPTCVCLRAKLLKFLARFPKI